MRRALFLIMTIIIIAALILPVLDINKDGSGASDSEISRIATIDPKMCTLGSTFKEKWDLIVCESFDDNTDLWVGNSMGINVSLEDGVYLVDNTETVGRIEPYGYSQPILVGAADDVMMSVVGAMDCLEGECAWGVFMRSTFDEIVYVFMIDNTGIFTLTGLSPEEISQEVGNIQHDNHPAIFPNGENTITAIAEASQMMFYVNDQLLATHYAYEAANPSFGLIVWGGSDAKAMNRFDSVLARGN